MINYAHRGASERAPENTLAAFYLGLEMGADGIETDVRSSSDGKLVLFHDAEMKRIAGVEGAVTDYSYRELLELDLGSHKDARYRNERIVSLEDFLKYFSGKEIALAIEIKADGIEGEILALVDAARCRHRSVLTSFHMEHLAALRRMNDDVSLGFLTETVDADTLRKLEEHRIGQICPRARTLDADRVALAHGKGFTLRAWGVEDDGLMRHAARCGVDGMTVNFPDRLAAFLRKEACRATTA